MQNWIRRYFIPLLGFSATFLILFFVFFKIFINEESIFYLINLNDKIDKLEKNIKKLDIEHEKLISKIHLLNDQNLDEDYISEIANKSLGLIKPDRVVVKKD